MIKKKLETSLIFFSNKLRLIDVRKATEDVRFDKSSGRDVPADVLKQCNLCFQALTSCINQSIVSGKFPDFLELTNISPVYKAKDSLDKSNYRPVSVLPLLSKIYERVVFDQLSRHVNKALSKLLCDFRKAHSTQHALFRLLQLWQKALDNSEYAGTVLMNLSKVYGCIPQDLHIAKLEA